RDGTNPRRRGPRHDVTGRQTRGYVDPPSPSGHRQLRRPSHRRRLRRRVYRMQSSHRRAPRRRHSRRRANVAQPYPQGFVMNDISIYSAAAIAGVVLILAVTFLYLVPLRLWIAAWSSGASVGLVTLIGMRLRRVPPSTVVTARISAVKAGLQVTTNDLEAHYLAGGNVVRVVQALI